MLPSGASSDIKDLTELMKALKHAITRIKEGDQDGAYAALRFARGIVNVSDFLEPHAKAIMTAVFAEFSSVLEPFSSDSDVLFDNFLRSMEFIYGSTHVVMSDCFTMVSSYYASSNRLSLAIDVSLSEIFMHLLIFIV
jgi:tryptophan 2,3-dioxygenase